VKDEASKQGQIMKSQAFLCFPKEMGKHWEIKSNVIPSDDYFTKESTISM
jgi:hypothetical protein